MAGEKIANPKKCLPIAGLRPQSYWKYQSVVSFIVVDRALSVRVIDLLWYDSL